ncbi:hypothetical protein NDS46_22700 [Paenibacillus thiaminolyticus]|nr:hypothetical protein [Paenibacillus thiaminolyticus]WCF07118.1 hypothetical protein NDS46_22700 [Paenibacillus thiaminolyticus]
MAKSGLVAECGTGAWRRVGLVVRYGCAAKSGLVADAVRVRGE